MSHLKDRFCCTCKQSTIVVAVIPAASGRVICIACASGQDWHQWLCKCGVWRWLNEHCETCNCSVKDVAEGY